MIETKPKNTSPQFGPGSRLAQAREDRGLSVEQAARALHLPPRHIQALEADDYEKLPGPTYVRGYLRSYAQFLELPTDEIIASYSRLPVAQQSVNLGKFAPPAQLSGDHKWVRPVTVLVLGLLVVLAGLWWYGEEESPARIPSLLSSPEDLRTKSPAAVLDRTVREPRAGLGTSPGNRASTESAQGAGIEGEIRAPSSASALAPAAGEATAIEEGPFSPSAGTASAAPRAAAAPTDRIPTAGPTSRVTGDGARARLVLQTREESWVEVRDAAGIRLLYETLPAGRTVSVEGRAPLSVFLGNVDGVRVEFNGKSYDTSRHKRGPVARFTLGEAQTARPHHDATR